MDWRGRHSHRRSRRRPRQLYFEPLECRLALSTASLASDDAAPMPWLTDAPAETAAPTDEEIEQNPFVFDAPVGPEPEWDNPETNLGFLDFAFDFTATGDGADLPWATTPEASVDMLTVDHVFALAAAAGEDALESRGDPAAELQKLAVLAPAILEAAFPRDTVMPLDPVLSVPLATTAPPRLALPASAMQKVHITSTLFGVGGSVADAERNADWHTSNRPESPLSPDPMTSPPMSSEPTMSPPMAVPPSRPEPMLEQAESRMSAAPAEMATPDDTAKPDDADKEYSAHATVALAGNVSDSREAAAHVAPARPMQPRGGAGGVSGVSAALLLWCLLLVAQCRILRTTRLAACAAVGQRRYRPWKPPDPWRPGTPQGRPRWSAFFVAPGSAG